MASLQELTDLASREGGKIFIVDASGNPAYVVMTYDAYRQSRIQPVYDQLASRLADMSQQIESLNEQITRAQADDVSDEVEPAELEEDAGSEDSLYIEPIPR